MDDDYEGGDGYYADESGEAPGSYTPRGSVFRRILDANKDSVKPHFGEEPDEEGYYSRKHSDDEVPHKENSRGTSRSESRAALSNAEKVASQKGESADEDLRSRENVGSTFKNNVGKMTPAGAISNMMPGKKKKKKKKKGLASVFVTSSLVLAGIFGVFGSQTSTLFQLVENVKQIHDTITTSKRMRTRAFYRYQADMSEGRVKKSCKSKVFNGDRFRLNPDGKMAKKLARVGIEVDADGKTMHWTDSSGKKYDIITDKHYKKLVKGSDVEKAKILADYKAQHGAELVGYEDFYTKNNQFRDSAYTALRTLKGAFHDLYSNAGKKVFKRLGNIKRFIFDGFKPDAENADADLEARLKNPDDFEVKLDIDEIERTSADDPDALRGTLDTGDGTESLKISDGDIETSRIKPGDAEETLNKVADKQKKSASSLVMLGVNTACIGIDFYNTVNLIVYGIQISHSVQEAVSFIEGVEMAKSEEYAANSPYHQFGQKVEQKINKTITRVKSINVANDDAEFETVEVNGSFSDSPSVAGIMSGEPVNPFNEIAQNYQASAGLNKFRDNLELSLETHYACTQTRRVTAIAGVVVDTIEAIACVFGECATMLDDVVWGIAGGFAFSLLIAGIIKIATPIVENALLVGTATAFVGPEKGEAFAHGAKKVFNTISVAESQAVKTKESLTASILKQQEVIAEDAEYARKHLSPFDTSSQYTFMGSLANSMAQIRLSNSFMSTLKNVGNVVVGSVNGLLPTASAIDVSEKSSKIVGYSEEACPELTSVNGVGDQFCEPYVGTDFSTIEADPADIVNDVDALGQFDGEDGDQPKIKKDGELAEYIIYCNQRTSPYGIADINIANQIGDWASFGTIPDAGIGAVPIVGDIVDIVQNQQKLDRWAYISGEACVEGNENTSAKVPDWETAKKYQRFIEDQYLAESEGLIPEGSNPVEKFIAEYYEEHPLDNSYEGIIARYSGQTKETVIAVLNEIEFDQWLAQYDPSNLGPMPNPQEEDYDYQFEGERTVVASVDAIFRAGFSEERRQRNFAA